MEVVASQIRKVHEKGSKIALLRDMAISFNCDPELIAVLQEFYDIEKQQINHIKEGIG